MTQVFGEDGKVYPATIVKVGPVVVTQVKGEKDGYDAMQVGFGVRKEKHIAKAQKGHAKGLGFFAGFREFRTDKESLAGVKSGDALDVTVFTPGDEVSITAISKGKGFQGVVKRHGFSGGFRTHGQKHSEREPGSIGGGGRAGGRVAKGMKMAGRMGGDRVTIHKVKVLQVSPEGGELVLHGSVPGRPGTVIEISSK